jgi:hypothetical protein
MPRRNRKTRARKSRKTRRQTRKQRRSRKQKGGGLPIPNGAVAGVRLDPKDEYSAPVLIGKGLFEKEVLEEDEE